MLASADKIKNPITGCMISIGGDTYNRLLAQGYKLINGILHPPSTISVTPYSPQINPYIPPQVNIMPHVNPYSPQVNIPQVNPYSPQVNILPQVNRYSHQVNILPQVNPYVVPGAVPSLGNMPIQVNELLKQEDATRIKLCNICKEYYINRSMPFTIPEINNLNKIVQACSECKRFCENNYSRRGINNPPECHQYKVAEISSKQQQTKLQSQITADQIRKGIHQGQDISYLFPKIPQ